MKVFDNTEFIDTGAAKGDEFQYVVTALDRLNNESEGIIIKMTSISPYFRDVSPDYNWALAAINDMYQRKIILGDGKGSFYPYQNTKRGDFILMVVRALGLYADVDENFDDVPVDSYYYNGIGIAKKLGVA